MDAPLILIIGALALTLGILWRLRMRRTKEVGRDFRKRDRDKEEMSQDESTL